MRAPHVQRTLGPRAEVARRTALCALKCARRSVTLAVYGQFVTTLKQGKELTFGFRTFEV